IAEHGLGHRLPGLTEADDLALAHHARHRVMDDMEPLGFVGTRHLFEARLAGLFIVGPGTEDRLVAGRGNGLDLLGGDLAGHGEIVTWRAGVHSTDFWLQKR